MNFVLEPGMRFIVENIKTGELRYDRVCLGEAHLGHLVSAGRGTYNLITGRHVCEPLVIVATMPHDIAK